MNTSASLCFSKNCSIHAQPHCLPELVGRVPEANVSLLLSTNLEYSRGYAGRILGRMFLVTRHNTTARMHTALGSEDSRLVQVLPADNVAGCATP